MKKITEQEENLKLIYVLKVGYNSKNEGLYEFIFSKDETNIDADLWRWDMTPACDYAQPPETEYVDKVVSLKTKKFNLFCLHEAVDREYMHGYHTIHALAYEKADDEQDGYTSYEDMYDDNNDYPLLVFHYGITLKKIKEMLYERKFIFRDNEFSYVDSVEI